MQFIGFVVVQIQVGFEVVVDLHLHHIVDLGGPVVETIVYIEVEDLFVVELGRKGAKAKGETNLCPGMCCRGKFGVLICYWGHWVCGG